MKFVIKSVGLVFLAALGISIWKNPLCNSQVASYGYTAFFLILIFLNFSKNVKNRLKKASYWFLFICTIGQLILGILYLFEVRLSYLPIYFDSSAPLGYFNAPVVKSHPDFGYVFHRDSTNHPRMQKTIGTYKLSEIYEKINTEPERYIFMSSLHRMNFVS